jgi:endonuclease/exonuclease/phosphatase family metal-dependent hydrolase
MILASYNVENLFRRARAMNQSTWQDGKTILTEYSRVNSLFQNPVYSAADKSAIVASLDKLGLKKSDESSFAILRQNHGHLLKRPKTGPPQVIATGRDDWVGWVELKTEPVNETATQMTAKVIHDVKADVIAIVEAEDRVALCQFNDQLLKPLNARYSHIMLIDGNDDRGIDVGLMCKGGCSIASMISHVDDSGNGHTIFSRDCPEYSVEVGPGKSFLLMINHLKSKGFGSQASSNARRKEQARRVRQIYDARRAAGIQHIAIVGDFNDTPDSDPLGPLLKNGSDLKDITQHPNFVGDGRLGTFANGAASNKIDYVLLSPALFNAVTSGGIFRQGVWGGTNGTLFPHYAEMTKPIHAASDHAAIWADLNL